MIEQEHEQAPKWKLFGCRGGRWASLSQGPKFEFFFHCLTATKVRIMDGA
jgi:hypothetical protein